MEFVMPILEGAWRYVLTLRISDYLDIALMAYAIYWLLKLVGTSKVESVGKVILLFLLALMLSDAFSLNGIYFLLSHILSLGALALIVLIFWRQGSFTALGQVNKLYWLGGVLGIVITLTVMLGIKSLGTTLSISIILISQLLIAAVIDAFGLMGSEKVAFGWSKYVGLALMTGGMLLFKYK